MEALKVPQRRALLETGKVERVNPTSEKLKFGRGTFKRETKCKKDIIDVDKWLSLHNEVQNMAYLYY